MSTSWIRAALLAASLVVFAAEVGFLSGSHQAAANPATTVSRYTGGSGASTTSDFYSLGCNRASGPAGVVVLDFGGAVNDPTYGWGVDPPGFASFWTINDVKARAEQFASGVYSCKSASTSIAMVIGTNNSASVVYAHGSAWATMVKDVQTYIMTGVDWSPWVNAYGGNDVEPAWSSSSSARDWYSGYTAVSGTQRIYNFGSADSCPQTYSLSGGVYVSGQTNVAMPACANSWTQDDIYYVSWQLTLAYSIPEVYTNYDASGSFSDQSVEWERIVRYVNLRYSRSMAVSGIMTQSRACSEIGCAPNVDNTPTQGYDQLWNSLQYIDGGSGAQTPVWLADISWNQ